MLERPRLADAFAERPLPPLPPNAPEPEERSPWLKPRSPLGVAVEGLSLAGTRLAALPPLGEVPPVLPPADWRWAWALAKRSPEGAVPPVLPPAARWAWALAARSPEGAAPPVAPAACLSFI